MTLTLRQSPSKAAKGQGGQSSDEVQIQDPVQKRFQLAYLTATTAASRAGKPTIFTHAFDECKPFILVACVILRFQLVTGAPRLLFCSLKAEDG